MLRGEDGTGGISNYHDVVSKCNITNEAESETLQITQNSLKRKRRSFNEIDSEIVNVMKPNVCSKKRKLSPL